jgi:hypothetical protein
MILFCPGFQEPHRAASLPGARLILRPAPSPDAATLPRHSVAVRALFLGTYALKGGDPQEIVCVTTAALSVRPSHGPQDDARPSRVRRVQARSGTADGAAASLPDILPGLREAFLKAAEADQQPPAVGSPADSKSGASGGRASFAAATACAPGLGARGGAAGAVGGGSGGGAAASSNGPSPASAYGAWLAQALPRRRLLDASCVGPQHGPLEARSFTAGP